MFASVIVGVDGGSGARDAIALARLLLAPGGGLTLAHVPTGVAPGASRSVARSLHRLVERSGSDLLVVGSSRHGVWGRALLGDDTRSVLHRAPCTVAVAPCGYALEGPVIQRIGVGSDGTREGEHALALARALSVRLGAQLTTFRAVPVPARSATNGSTTDEPSLDDLLTEASEALSSIPDADAEVTYGEPPVELAFFSDSVDLLVVGTRDRGVVGELLHGSTAGKLARSTGCPLLVVPGGVGTRPGGVPVGLPEVTPSIG